MYRLFKISIIDLADCKDIFRADEVYFVSVAIIKVNLRGGTVIPL